MEKNPQFIMIASPLHSPDRMISLIFREYYSGIRRIPSPFILYYRVWYHDS